MSFLPPAKTAIAEANNNTTETRNLLRIKVPLHNLKTSPTYRNISSIYKNTKDMSIEMHKNEQK
ncbi:hypothetical protein TREAZ_2188 [Leadbettera azotonutricia ZAS-9]|uniref:Uncharacterized protein n=1 Tax=Leadbettera azotonutricia (strain ATCC BAA-888 / DSM 13862 / ZAS-9) TaxID=545695 RepID=F5Y8R8_LEAAZ|nr:hypothetical protein TREAZ_2188 [Leadbettera azotonutricia ZAS-9]